MFVSSGQPRSDPWPSDDGELCFVYSLNDGEHGLVGAVLLLVCSVLYVHKDGEFELVYSDEILLRCTSVLIAEDVF